MSEEIPMLELQNLNNRNATTTNNTRWSCSSESIVNSNSSPGTTRVDPNGRYGHGLGHANTNANTNVNANANGGGHQGEASNDESSVSLNNLINSQRRRNRNDTPVTITSRDRRIVRISRGGGEGGGILNGIRNFFWNRPIEIPLSPNTRNSANSQRESGKQSITLRPIKLIASLSRNFLKIEPIELKRKYRISLVIDCDEAIIVKLLSAKEKLLTLKKVQIPAMSMILDFEVVMKAFPSSSMLYKVIIEPGERAITRLTPIIKTVLEVKPFGGEGAMEIRILDQRLLYDLCEFEVLDIYGQSRGEEEGGEGEREITMKDLVGNSCVSVTMSEKRLSSRRGDCVICLSESRDTLFLPCRHLCICSNCAENFLNSESKCPLCRQGFLSIISIKEEFIINPSKSTIIQSPPPPIQKEKAEGEGKEEGEEEDDYDMATLRRGGFKNKDKVKGKGNDSFPIPKAQPNKSTSSN